VILVIIIFHDQSDPMCFQCGRRSGSWTTRPFARHFFFLKLYTLIARDIRPLGRIVEGTKYCSMPSVLDGRRSFRTSETFGFIRLLCLNEASAVHLYIARVIDEK